MRERNSEQIKSTSDIKTHEEIVGLIDEIKGFETRFEDFEMEEPTIIEEMVPLESDNLKEFEPIPIKTEPEIKVRRKKHPIFRIKSRSRAEVQRIKRERQAVTFKIGFDEEGKLVNLDLKKPKPKVKKQKAEGKRRISIKRLRKGKEGEEKTETKETEGRFSKLKSGFGKLGKIKRAIPSKNKETEESEKEE